MNAGDNRPLVTLNSQFSIHLLAHPLPLRSFCITKTIYTNCTWDNQYYLIFNIRVLYMPFQEINKENENIFNEKYHVK